MTVELAADPDSLMALADDWRRLWREREDASPFLAPDWLLPWWTVFGGAGRPLVATERRPDNRLAAILPLHVAANGKILPLGVGISDQAGLLQARDAPPGAAARLLALALGMAGPVHRRCDLPELAPGDPLLDVPPPEGWVAEEWDGPPCPVLALVPQPLIPPAMRRDLRQARNRASRRGRWSVEPAENAADLASALDELEALHRARWSERGETGVLADAEVRRFHRLAVTSLQAAGLLRLRRLRIDGAVAGVIHALLDPTRIHFYIGGFDPGYGFESPGTLLIGALIDEAVRDGRREAHFLRGGERYKYGWGAVDRFNRGRSFRRA